MSFDPKVINALAEARQAISRMGKPGIVDNFDRYQEQGLRLLQAVNVLDNAGVFAALDEQTGYASAVEILAESARADLEKQIPNTADPAEWGDTTSADMARHQIQDVNRGSDYGLTEEEGRRAGLGSALPPRQDGYAAASGLGGLERVPGTDTLRPAPQGVPLDYRKHYTRRPQD